jgi:hypothetical protein
VSVQLWLRQPFIFMYINNEMFSTYSPPTLTALTTRYVCHPSPYTMSPSSIQCDCWGTKWFCVMLWLYNTAAVQCKKINWNKLCSPTAIHLKNGCMQTWYAHHAGLPTDAMLKQQWAQKCRILTLCRRMSYIYIYMSYRTANLQTLHFKYFFNKYPYWIF